MAPRTRYVVGDLVVWQGQGLVRVEGTEDRDGASYWVMKSVAVGTTMMIPTDTVENVVRRPVSGPEAERLAGVLRQQTGASDDRPWAVRFHEYMVTLIKRPLEAQVNVLHALCAPLKATLKKANNPIEREALRDAIKALAP